MRSAIFFIAALFTTVSAWGQPSFKLTRIDTPPQTDAIALYAKDEIPEGNVVERWNILDRGDGKIESRRVRNVTWPTITPVLPAQDKANGLAVLVAPGGAFKVLAIDKEGYDIANYLAEHGIAAFVLKYRINETPDDEGEIMRTMAANRSAANKGEKPPEIQEPRAGADALQALRLIRERAAEWGVDPERVGFIGFSAGAMTGLQAVMTGEPDDQPDFMGYIYGPLDTVVVPKHAPPMFSALAMDDPLFAGRGFGLIEAWHQAGIPVELHAYEMGGHGFGTGRSGTTSVGIMDQFILWLESRKLLSN